LYEHTFKIQKAPTVILLQYKPTGQWDVDRPALQWMVAFSRRWNRPKSLIKEEEEEVVVVVVIVVTVITAEAAAAAVVVVLLLFGAAVEDDYINTLMRNFNT
jgi:hypothetical protein